MNESKSSDTTSGTTSDTSRFSSVLSDSTVRDKTETFEVPKEGSWVHMKDILHQPADYRERLDRYAKKKQSEEPLVLARLKDVNFISGILHVLQNKIGTRQNKDKLIYFANAANSQLSKSHMPQQSEVIELALKLYKSEMDAKFKNFRMVSPFEDYLLVDISMNETNPEMKCQADVVSKGIYALQHLIRTVKNSDRQYIYVGVVPTGSINESGRAVVDTYLIRQLCCDVTGITSCSGFFLNEVQAAKHEKVKKYSLSNQAHNIVLTGEHDTMRIYKYQLKSETRAKATLFQAVQGVLTVAHALHAISEGNQLEFEISMDQTQKYLQNFVLKQFEGSTHAITKMAANALEQGVDSDLQMATDEGYKLLRETDHRDSLLSILLQNKRPFTPEDIDAKRELVKRSYEKTEESDIFFEVFYQLLIQKLEGMMDFQQELQSNIMDGSFVDIGLIEIRPTIYEHLRCMPYGSYLNFRVQESPAAWCLVQHGVDINSDNRGVYQVWDITDNSDVMIADAYGMLHNKETWANGAHEMQAERHKPKSLSAVVTHIKRKVELNDTYRYGDSRKLKHSGGSVYVLGTENTKFAADDELFRSTRFAVIGLNDGNNELSAKLLSKYENDHSKGYMQKRVRQMFDKSFSKIQKDMSVIATKDDRWKVTKAFDWSKGKVAAGAGVYGAASIASSVAGLAGISKEGGALVMGTKTLIAGTLLPWMPIIGVGVLGLGAGAKLAYDYHQSAHAAASAEIRKFYTNPSPKIVQKEDVTGSNQQELREINRLKYEKFFEDFNANWTKSVYQATQASFDREWLGAFQENVISMKDNPEWDGQCREIAIKACTSLGISGDSLDKEEVAYLDPNFKTNMMAHANVLHQSNALLAQVHAMKKLMNEEWLSWLNQSVTNDFTNVIFNEQVKQRGTELISKEMLEIMHQCTKQFDAYFLNTTGFRTTTAQQQRDKPLVQRIGEAIIPAEPAATPNESESTSPTGPSFGHVL